MSIPVLKNASVVFWDFDGVIKESVSVKTEAFARLFEGFGADIAARVREHHEANGGMSRYEKIPLYLSWAGIPPTADEVNRYCTLFSARVRDAVISAPWVPGVPEYLTANHERQRFALVSATPQDELEGIVAAVGLSGCFREIHGAPTAKAVAVRSVLERWQCAPEHAVVVGDASADRAAAEKNGVPFILRRTPLNVDIQRQHTGAAFDALA